MKAAEEFTRRQGGSSLYLHCRVVDEPAKQLYLTEGYEVLRTDLPGLGLVPGLDRRVLMRKQLLI